VAEMDLKDRLIKILGHDYVVAHHALAYYGKWTAELNATGYTNLRDALSHLRRFFDPALPNSDRAEQLTCAAEHIRRAATEAYQECFELYHDHARESYKQYREECIHKEQTLGYSGTFDHEHIIAELKRLRKELKECRRGKDGTDLDSLVERLVPACEDIMALAMLIQQCWQKHNECTGEGPIEPWP